MDLHFWWQLKRLDEFLLPPASHNIQSKEGTAPALIRWRPRRFSCSRSHRWWPQSDWRLRVPGGVCSFFFFFFMDHQWWENCELSMLNSKGSGSICSYWFILQLNHSVNLLSMSRGSARVSPSCQIGWKELDILDELLFNHRPTKRQSTNAFTLCKLHRPHVRIFGLWQEVRKPEESLCRRRENIPTPLQLSI